MTRMNSHQGNSPPGCKGRDIDGDELCFDEQWATEEEDDRIKSDMIHDEDR